MLAVRKRLELKKTAYLVLAIFFFGLLYACNFRREYFRTEFTSASPGDVNFIYRITTQGAGGWGPHDRQYYFSNDSNGKFQFPEPRYKIPLSSQTGLVPGAGIGCLQVFWKSDYEATVRYCLDGGTYPDTKTFDFKGNQITLHFERAPNCKPEEITDLLYRLKGEKNLCRYYFPEEKPQQSLIAE